MKKEKEKIKSAVALEYDPSEEAPKIIATGKGVLAEKIIEKAKEANVPIHEDEKLAKTLSKLEIGDMIPPELYNAVAEVLVFVDAMEKIRSKENMEELQSLVANDIIDVIHKNEDFEEEKRSGILCLEAYTK